MKDKQTKCKCWCHTPGASYDCEYHAKHCRDCYTKKENTYVQIVECKVTKTSKGELFE